jgi:large subunit ribosomal protein L24
MAERLAPARLRATLDVAPAPGGNGRTLAKLSLGGDVGAMRVNLAATAAGETLNPSSVVLKLEGGIDADDGGNVLGLLGLSPLLAAEGRPQQFNFAAEGPLGGDLKIEGRLAGEVDASASGTMHFVPAAAGSVDLKVVKADLRRLRRAAAGKPADPLPLTLRSRVNVTGNKITLASIGGAVGGAPVKGQLALTLGAAARVDGSIETSALDALGILALGIGMPEQGTAWSADPFLAGLYPAMSGRVNFKAARSTFGPKLVAKDFEGTLRLAPSEIAVEDIKGELAGGQLSGQVSFRTGNDGVTARGRIALKQADASLVIPGGSRPAFNGDVSVQVEAEGTGLSPKALIGSLGGTGMVTLEKTQVSGLNAKAFPSVIRAVDQGLSVDAPRVRGYMASALDAGRLALPQVDAAITIAGGQVRIGTVVARGEGADVAVSGTYELANDQLDARVTLSGPAAANIDVGRPEVGIVLKGPLAAPRRSLDVAALSGWLALRSVEQQSKRVEEAERLAAEHARREAERSREEAERLAAIKAKEELDRRRGEGPQPTLAPLSPATPFQPAPSPPPALPSSAVPDLQTTTSRGQLAPALPPPIEIRPAAGAELAPVVPRPRNPPPRPPAVIQPSSSGRAPLDLGLIGSQ